jgi:hypothetical protein
LFGDELGQVGGREHDALALGARADSHVADLAGGDQPSKKRAPDAKAARRILEVDQFRPDCIPVRRHYSHRWFEYATSIIVVVQGKERPPEGGQVGAALPLPLQGGKHHALGRAGAPGRQQAGQQDHARDDERRADEHSGIEAGDDKEDEPDCKCENERCGDVHGGSFAVVG